MYVNVCLVIITMCNTNENLNCNFNYARARTTKKQKKKMHELYTQYRLVIDKDWPGIRRRDSFDSTSSSNSNSSFKLPEMGYIELDHEDITCTVGLTKIHDFKKISKKFEFPWYKIKKLELQTKILSYRNHTGYAKTKDERRDQMRTTLFILNKCVDYTRSLRLSRNIPDVLLSFENIENYKANYIFDNKSINKKKLAQKDSDTSEISETSDTSSEDDKIDDREIWIGCNKECPKFSKLLHLDLNTIQLKDSFTLSLFQKNRFNIFNLQILELSNHCSSTLKFDQFFKCLNDYILNNNDNSLCLNLRVISIMNQHVKFRYKHKNPQKVSIKRERIIIPKCNNLEFVRIANIDRHFVIDLSNNPNSIIALIVDKIDPTIQLINSNNVNITTFLYQSYGNCDPLPWLKLTRDNDQNNNFNHSSDEEKVTIPDDEAWQKYFQDRNNDKLLLAKYYGKFNNQWNPWYRTLHDKWEFVNYNHNNSKQSLIEKEYNKNKGNFKGSQVYWRCLDKSEVYLFDSLLKYHYCHDISKYAKAVSYYNNWFESNIVPWLKQLRLANSYYLPSNNSFYSDPRSMPYKMTINSNG